MIEKGTGERCNRGRKNYLKKETRKDYYVGMEEENRSGGTQKVLCFSSTAENVHFFALESRHFLGIQRF